MQRTEYTGRTLDNRYRVLEQIGKGGMGSVYRGQHVLVGRKVAIKILHSQFLGDEEMVTRFYREARAAAAIGHRNIIEVIDVGATEEGDPYLVMEYLEGESLGAMLKRTGPIGLAAACGILEPALRALGAAHREKIIHRDLKPDNIFLSYRPGEATEIKLIDFGISKVVPDAEQTRLTQTGHLIGTPAYMSPEQARGESDVDERSDIYAMGVILYEMLSGQLPFQGANYNALLANILTGSPLPPMEANPCFPPEAIPVVESAMHRDAERRYRDAGEMLEDLRALRGYESRQERLDVLASGIVAVTLPAGDLGGSAGTPGSAKDMAANEMARIASAGTPTGWSRARPGRRRFALWAIALAAAVAVLIGVALFALGPGATGDPVPAPARGGERADRPRPDEGAGATVTITVEGVPEGSSIHYDGAPVPMNPFPARRGEGLVPIKVVAAGHEPFATSIVPDRDQAVRVALQPLAGVPVVPPAPAAGAEPEAVRVKAPVRKGASKGQPAKDESGDGFIKDFN